MDTPVESSAPALRDRFSSRLGVLAATLGSAVGLGNIWKFPSVIGSNGGAVFILIYLCMVVLVGIPVAVLEISLGRKACSNAVGTMRKLAPKGSFWWIVGAMGILAAFLIMAFYTEVAGWVFAYIFQSLTGTILSSQKEVTGTAFTALITDPIQSLVWQWVNLAVIGVIILFGVSKGIENATKRLMPILLGLLVLVSIRSLTLPGAAEGLNFLFMPDFSKVGPTTILVALGLAFFKLSIGMGCMITYGSYFRDDQDIPTTSVRVALGDLTIALLAGIAVFPAVFAYGFEPGAGPALLFITIPAVFASMPLGNIFMVLFFILAYIASIGAQLSLLEVSVSFINDHFHFSRRKGSLITIGLIALLGSTAALSNSLLANVKLFGLTAFDLFDFVSSNVLLPLGGLLLCVFVGWVYGYERFKADVTNNGELNNAWVAKGLFFLIRFVAPVLILLIFLNSLNIIKF
ncbi:MAG TPA: sodium-dependent transporter [Anaerolineaceae bacterium]|nr:sodium-dependent transporter [Anaerolineaceae bacterium]HPN50193.1 sodium-dependent transporter [Anaerolineaceae bacterium]